MDYTTPVGRLRLLIGDADPDKPILGDPEIGGFLALSDGNVLLGAADALDAIASSEALLSKKITTQDRSTDGPSVAAELRKHAATLRQRHRDQVADGESFFIITGTGSSRVEGEEYR